MQQKGQISLFGLYGEEVTGEDLELVHIERISTRARLHDWQIEPHAHRGMFQVLFLSAGQVGIRIDGSESTMSAPAIVSVPSSFVHGFQLQPGSEGWVLTVGESRLSEESGRRGASLVAPLLLGPQRLAMSQDESTLVLLQSMLENLWTEFNWPQFGRSAVMDWMIRIILVTIRRQQEQVQPAGSGKRQQHELFATFRQLVERNYRLHWPVETYAATLGVTAQRLKRLCLAKTGKTAGNLVQDRLMLEAQRLLIYTNATSSMVAYELGFQDPSYFSRCFKRRVGLSPIAFRARQEKAAHELDPRPVAATAQPTPTA